MKLYRRKTGTHVTVHAQDCRYNEGRISRWEWSVGKTSKEIQAAIEGLGSYPCTICRPFDHKGTYE